MATLQDIQTKLAALTTAGQQGETLLQQILAKLGASAADQPAIDAAAAQLDTLIAAANTANGQMEAVLNPPAPAASAAPAA